MYVSDRECNKGKKVMIGFEQRGATWDFVMKQYDQVDGPSMECLHTLEFNRAIGT